MKKTEWNGRERRQSQRWNLTVPLRVFQAHTEVVIGHVVDVSLHGMRVVSNDLLNQEQTMNFEIELPDDTGQWKKTPVTAVSVYSQPDADRGVYFTGFKFVSIEPETLFRFQQLIDELAPFS